MASHYLAQVYEDMASIADVMFEIDGDHELASVAAAAEVRAALRLTRRAADSELGFALDLMRRLPAVWEALSAGSIDVRRARTIVYGTSHLSEELARQVMERIIGRVPQLTTGQLATLLRRLCVEADPHDAVVRYGEALSERRVILEATVAGTANLMGLDLPSERAAGVMRLINEMARRLRVGGESRTMDQLRADVLLDLLEGKNRHGKSGRGSVDIQVDLATLTRLAENPAELAGYGPIIADIARQIAADQTDGEWRWTVTDPQTGLPIHNRITRRRPTAGQLRHVQARNRTCVFPGCRMPAVACDVDHRIPWAQGGPTDVDYLAPACRHDHIVVRHRLGWKYRPLPGGDYLWTSRLGHQYTTSGRPP
jgi:hypothetical protein